MRLWGRVGRGNALCVHENDGRIAVFLKSLPFRVRDMRARKISFDGSANGDLQVLPELG